MTTSLWDTFTLKTPREWAAIAPRGGIEGAVKAAAKERGVAGIVRANDDVVLYQFDAGAGKITKKVFRERSFWK
jgi:hypothetical protein